MRYLVVEDDETAASALGRLLAPMGDVVVACTARGALRVLSEHRAWSAFFLGVRLPDGSGLEVLMHARVDFPATPAMVLTCNVDARTVNTAFDLGAEYVVKPLERDRILRFLEARDFAARLRRVTAEYQKRYGLSPAETDVLERSAAGLTREQVAALRSCSPLTLKTHVAHLLGKTGDQTLSEVVARLLRQLAGAGDDHGLLQKE